MDCICCGFGAVILLFSMNKAVRNNQTTMFTQEATIEVVDNQEERTIINSQIMYREIEAKSIEEELANLNATLEILEEKEASVVLELDKSGSDYDQVVKDLKESIAIALQQKETIRKTPPPWRTDLVGGIPADSEYVIFIIDTSGSMASISRQVAEKLKEVLSVYPAGLKGMQLMNADGGYLVPSSRRSWLPTDLKGRRDMLQQYISWQNSSSSSPIGGIQNAITDYGGSGKEISIYVFGDDFSGDIDRLISRVDGMNLPNAAGERPFRIHAVGFAASGGSSEIFSRAMSALCERNQGAFIGLSN